MDSRDDPYLNLLEIMQGQNKAANPYLIGIVISANPLLIETNDIQLDRNDILINQDITTFEVNDKVVFLVSNDQEEFILICKVR